MQGWACSASKHNNTTVFSPTLPGGEEGKEMGSAHLSYTTHYKRLPQLNYKAFGYPAQ